MHGASSLELFQGTLPIDVTLCAMCGESFYALKNFLFAIEAHLDPIFSVLERYDRLTPVASGSGFASIIPLADCTVSQVMTNRSVRFGELASTEPAMAPACALLPAPINRILYFRSRLRISSPAHRDVGESYSDSMAYTFH